ncbi:hypothetical protein [Peribacillus asahii]
MKLVKLQNEKIPPIALGTWSWGTGTNGGDAVPQIAIPQLIQ